LCYIQTFYSDFKLQKLISDSKSSLLKNLKESEFKL
jgi:hypothetical protein